MNPHFKNQLYKAGIQVYETATGPVVSIPSLSTLDEVTATSAELNQLHSQGAVAADFAKLHALTATAAELNNSANALLIVRGVFVETANTAGTKTYTWAHTIPAGYSIDFVLSKIAVEAAFTAETSATFKLGTAADDDGLATGMDVKSTAALTFNGALVTHQYVQFVAATEVTGVITTVGAATASPAGRVDLCLVLFKTTQASVATKA